MKKALICGVVLSFFCTVGLAVISVASDKGPAEITLESTIDKATKPKPAVFPHAKHQESLKCAECHHSKDADGKQVAYVEGQEIAKCESCHNKAAGMPAGLQTFKDAAHKNCKDCHKAKGAPTKCDACHPKK